MRFVLFYSSVESFNYFTNQITKELQNRGHETFILDLEDLSGQNGNQETSLSALSIFLTAPIDMVIAYDGLGIKQDMFIDLWNSLQVLCVNILMDHPLRFHETMNKHPNHYIQFCCDHDHVDYVKKYFSDQVDDIRFLPHAGTVCDPAISDEPKIYDVLFCGTYYVPDSYFDTINNWFEPGSSMNQFYRILADYMITHYEISTEQAVLKVLKETEMTADTKQLLTIMRCAEPIDWRSRMYYREQVIQTLVDAGIEVYLLGRGWENHPSFGKPNMHIINTRIPFEETFPYMQRAKINLNIMPWFKNGTHDRIFNIYLNHSLPLTDPSNWLLKHYSVWRSDTDNETGELPIFSLGDMGALPQTVAHLLNNDSLREQLIMRGKEKTQQSFTWKSLVDTLLTCL